MPAREVLEAARESTGLPAETARRLLVAWQHPQERSVHPVGFLSQAGQEFRFGYIRNAVMVSDFRPLLGFEELDRCYRSSDLFPLFAQRAMDPRRPDYQRYVRNLGLDGDPSPWEQIARSQGRREGDTIQLLPEPGANGDTLTCMFLVHGIRHAHQEPKVLNGVLISVTRQQIEGALATLKPGDELGIIPEPHNAKNPHALVVMGTEQVPLGWVPDLLVADLRKLMARSRVTLTAEQVNGSDAPWHMRLLVRLRAAPRGDFRFFTGERWQLLAADCQ